ncbi:uncharacterized protein I206_104695 [Kwoniella pini CBS 10737]|uniref:Poly(A) RNA polymerase mitochondrial-like central palm domain-containing protein n=1 Tax=Kwoniella pini CBS 10737 TaxID=1296096 RepID=A0A1B9I7S2_9TREE|nr:uncharacterized protein I206_02233 [Kwoniella pini CBS 10737]OCF51519.1 hypothetical protein I206_02233 [Kwoniella pini CBS 10737]
MLSSITITPIQPSILPSPRLISFPDDPTEIPSLMDVEEYDPPPSTQTPTATVHPDPTETDQSGGHPSTPTQLDPRARAYFPSTPQPIFLSSSENLGELFRLRSPVTSPSLPNTPFSAGLERRLPGTPTSPGSTRQSRRRLSVSSLGFAANSRQLSPYKRRTSARPAKYPIKLFYPPSPVLDTPDLTSGSTDHSFISSRGQTYISDQAIILTKPSELENLFKYHGEAYPFPGVNLPKKISNTKTSTEQKIEVLIDFDDSESPLPTNSLVSDPEHSQEVENSEETLLEGIDGYLDVFYEVEGGLSSPIDYKFGSEFQSDELDDIEDSIEVAQGYRSDIELLEMLNGNNSNAVTQIQETDFYKQVHAAAEALKINPISSKVPNTSARVQNVSPYDLLLSLPSPRKNVPRQIANPSTPDKFQSEIIQAWVKTEPTEQSKQFVKTLLSSLTKIINAKYGDSSGENRFLVDVFGSVSWGGETGKSGDLDLVILDRAQLRGYEPSLWRQPPNSNIPSKKPDTYGRRSVPPQITALPRCYHTYDLANSLRASGMREVQPIAAASTPIVKFKDTQGVIECDINMNDLGGWYNSSLILHYCLISPHLLRPMIYILKRWLSAQDLNDASGSKGSATMSSYCLTLMVIAYLQARGCLPNLQKNINVPLLNSASDTNDKDVIWVSWSRDQGVPAHVAFDRGPPEGWKSADPNLTVSQAVRGFFRFFSRSQPSALASNEEKARFDHRKMILSILQGGIANRVMGVGQGRVEDEKVKDQLRHKGSTEREVEEAMIILRDGRIKGEEKMGKGDRGIQPRNWSERRLVVQDPFLWQKNCAGSMSRVGLDRFFDCVDRAHHMLQSKGTSATIEELLFNPSPIPARIPTPGRGRGSRGSSPSWRGRGNGRTLLNS